jgi:hypothetical protein
MADIERLQRALIAADQAGDTEAATALARALRAAIAPKSQPTPPPDPSVGGGTLSIGPFDTGIRTSQAVDRALAGAGKFLFDVGRGVKQLTGNMSREEVDEVKRRDAPLMHARAGKVGNIGGGIAFSLPLAMVPGINTYAGATLAGAGMGALQPVGTDDSRLVNVGLGAAGGAGGKFLGNRLGAFLARARQSPQMSSQASSQASATPGAAGAETTITGGATAQGRSGGYTFGTVGEDTSAGLTQAQRQAAQRGKELGFRLTPGQATGSRALQQLEAKLESQPMTSGPFNAIKAQNARALNRAFLRAIGERGDDVTPEVLQRADARIGEVFEEAARQNQVVYDDVLQAQLAEIEQAASNELSSGEMKILIKQFENLLDKVAQKGGRIDGAQYQRIRQSLTRVSGNASSGVGYWARQIRDALDEALERSAGPDQAEMLRLAREQYRILATALNRTGAITQGGTVQPGILGNALAQTDKRGYMLGENQSDLYNALRFANAFRPIVGDSGTATRSALPGPTDFLLSMPFNIATRAYASSPAVSLAVRSQAATQAAGDATRTALAPLGPYLPRYVPPIGGLLGAELASQ